MVYKNCKIEQNKYGYFCYPVNSERGYINNEGVLQHQTRNDDGEYNAYFKTEDQVKEAIDKYYAKQDSLSEENSESLEETRIYTGREVWEALLDGKKLVGIQGGQVVSMNRFGQMVWGDSIDNRIGSILDIEMVEYKEPKQHTHQELEDILGYKFKYVS